MMCIICPVESLRTQKTANSKQALVRSGLEPGQGVIAEDENSEANVKKVELDWRIHEPNGEISL